MSETHTTFTAELTTSNQELQSGSWDTITVRDAAGNEVDWIYVRSSDDHCVYDAALVEQGYGAAQWI